MRKFEKHLPLATRLSKDVNVTTRPEEMSLSKDRSEVSCGKSPGRLARPDKALIRVSRGRWDVAYGK